MIYKKYRSDFDGINVLKYHWVGEEYYGNSWYKVKIYTTEVFQGNLVQDGSFPVTSKTSTNHFYSHIHINLYVPT